MRGFAGAFLTIFNVLYVGILLNILLAVTCAPVWILAVLVDLQQSWLWLAVTSILLGPALAGAYAVLRVYSMDASTAVIRTYFTTWARSWRRVWPVSLGLAGFFLLVGLDLYTMRAWGYGVIALPLSIVLVALAVASAAVAWVGFAARPELSRWAICKASLYLAVRKAGYSLLTLIVLAVAAAAVWMNQTIGLGIVASPVLYVVWANSRRVFTDYLPQSELRTAVEE